MNSFKSIEYQSDLDRAVTYALQDLPHLERALEQMVIEKMSPADLPESELVSKGLRSAVYQSLGPVLRARKLEPRAYFTTLKQRRKSA